MNKKKIKYKFFEHTFPFVFNQRRILKKIEKLTVSEWADKNFYLSKSYAMPGKVTLYPFQHDLVNSVLHYRENWFVGPVQASKSLCAEIIQGYLIDYTNENMMFVYDQDKKMPSIFSERLKPMITDVPAIAKYWSGAEDDLTQSKMNLNHLIIRAAGAGPGAKSAIASHNAGNIYGDEVAKWPIIKGFSQLKALKGRLESTELANRPTYETYCTSPVDQHDQAYLSCHDQNANFFRLFYKCPHPNCGKYIQFILKNIKEIPNKFGKKDHLPSRIEADGAAYYECPECKKEIDDDDRRGMLRTVRWFTVNFKDKMQRVPLNPKATKAIWNWNRLCMPYYNFSKALAMYWTAFNSSDPGEMHTHINEDWGEWIEHKENKLQEQFLKEKTMKYEYYQSQGNDEKPPKIPSFAKILFCGIDTQDHSGFYVSVRAVGLNGESCNVFHTLIECDKADIKYHDKSEILKLFREKIINREYITEDGSKLNFLFGLIDRGGHRAADVDYLAARIPWLSAYIGATDNDAKIIEYSKTGSWYLGNTRNLSLIFASKLRSNFFYLPKDFTKDYGKQILAQFYEERVEAKSGRPYMKWVTLRDDHYRDCENLIEGAMIITKFDQCNQQIDVLQKIADNTNIIRENQSNANNDPSEIQDNFINDFKNDMDSMGW